jgi:hypothetical protein
MIYVCMQVEYRPHRLASVTAISYSPYGDLLAACTSECRIDILDVYGLASLTDWITLRTGIVVDMGGFDYTCADGVIICKTVQKVIEPFATRNARMQKV